MGWMAGGLHLKMDISGRKMDGITYTQRFHIKMFCLVLSEQVRKGSMKCEERKKEDESLSFRFQLQTASTHLLGSFEQCRRQLVQVILIRVGPKLCRKVALQEQNWTPLAKMQLGQLREWRTILIEELTAMQPPRDREENHSILQGSDNKTDVHLVCHSLFAPIVLFSLQHKAKRKSLGIALLFAIGR